MKVLILTNLLPSPWDPMRGSFNRQQFGRLAERHSTDALVAVDFRQRWRGKRGTVDSGALRQDYFTFVYPPRFGRSLHGWCWLICVLLQRGLRLRRAGYDCLLVSWAYPDGAAARRLARWLGIPYVLKVHGSDLNVQAEHYLRRRQIRAALRDAAAVVAVSRALGDKAVAIGAGPGQVRVIYNGVNSDLFTSGDRYQARRDLGIDDQGPLVLFVGNLKASKGCLDLLEAFPAVLAQRADARLVFVGDGPSRARIAARAAELGCADQVRCVGAIAHAHLAPWFRAASLLCLPSHNEGVPNVILEAMACGIPVVATHVGGIPEVVTDFSGNLVPVHDQVALSRALVDTLGRDWDGTQIIQHARTFQWKDNVDQLDAVLRAATPHARAQPDDPHEA